jgi:hypothetical protein
MDIQTRITDPARLLAGFTFTVDAFLSCYCIGCYDEAQVGRLHKQFGPVDACQRHDPERFSQTRAFGVEPVVEPQDSPEGQTDGDEAAPKSNEEIIAELFKQIVRLTQQGDSGPGGGGKGAKLRKPKPTRPSGGITLPTPSAPRVQARAA